MQLKDIANLQIGLVLSRKQSKSVYAGTEVPYQTLTLSALTQEGIDKSELVQFYAKEEMDEKYISNLGDIIMRLSEPNYSAMVDASNKDILIPSQFLRIRITSKKLLPGYLTIYLNSDKVMRQFERLKMGSVIRVLSVTELSEIEIPIPPIDKQRKIEQLFSIMQKQIKIKNSLKNELEKRNKYYIKQLLKESCHDN